MKNTRKLRNKIAKMYLMLSYVLFGIAVSSVILALVLGSADPEYTDIAVWAKWFIPTLAICGVSLWGSVSLQKFLKRKGYLRKKDMLFDE